MTGDRHTTPLSLRKALAIGEFPYIIEEGEAPRRLEREEEEKSEESEHSIVYKPYT